MSKRNTPYHGGTKRSADSMTVAQIAQYFNSRSAQNEVTNPYATVAAVYACVKKKADALAMLPLRVSTVNDEVQEDGPIVEAIEQPNRTMTGRACRRAISAYLDLFGLVYIVKLSMGGALHEYYPVSSMEMTEHRGNGGIIGYTYTPRGDAQGVTMNLALDQVHRIIDPDFGSSDLSQALSPRRAIALAISQHYQADIANDRSLKHGAGGGLALKTPHNLGEEQKKELNQTLDDRHSGAGNRHRWMLLEGGLSVEKLFSTFSEMEFSELKYFSREDICVGFGVNPLVAGFSGKEGLGSGQHTDAAHLIFWTDTMMPRAEWIAEELQLALAGHFDKDQSLSLRHASKRSMRIGERRCRSRRELASRAKAVRRSHYFWFDFSGVPVLHRTQLAMADQALKWITAGVTLNQVLAANDLPFEEVPWGNTWYKPFNLVDVQTEQGAATSAAPSGSEPTDDEMLDDAADDSTATDEGKSVSESSVRLTASQADGLWANWWASWQPLRKQAVNKHQALLYEARAETLRNLERLMPGSDEKSVASVHRNLIGQILFDIRAFNGKLVAFMRPIIRQGNNLGGEQSMLEAAAAEAREDKPSPYNIQDPQAVKSMSVREVRIKGTTDTTRRQIAESLAQGIEKGETTAQLAERIRTKFNIASSRAASAAITEVGGAVEDGRQVGRQQSGIPAKSWLWSRKETGRWWHRDTEDATRDKPIANADLFTIADTGSRTLYPRGSDLPAKDAVHCGCTTLSRYFDAKKDAVLISHLMIKGFYSGAQL